MYTISWISEERSLDTVDEVDALIDELHDLFRAGDATLVTVTVNRGDSLTIGLGADLSVLSFVGRDGNPPYFLSTGDSTVDEEVSFRFGNQWSFFEMRNTIAFDLARDALRAFCRTGTRSDLISWEET